MTEIKEFETMYRDFIKKKYKKPLRLRFLGWLYRILNRLRLI